MDKLKQLFEPPLQVLKLYTPPPDLDDPAAPQTGITAWQFPEWFITQDIDPHVSDGFVRARMLVHRRMLTKGKFIGDSFSGSRQLFQQVKSFTSLRNAAHRIGQFLRSDEVRRRHGTRRQGLAHALC